MESVLYAAPPDRKSSRFFIAYCVISTLFCVHLLYLVKFNLVAPVNCLDPPALLKPNMSLKPNTSDHSPSFPKKIWQTAKTGPARLDEDDRNSVRSWMMTNPQHRYEILTQYSGESYVKDRFPHRPDIQEIFVDLQDPILRADFIRYLVLLGDGGAYSDMDTMSLRPIDDWIPSAHANKVNLVVGVEYDKLDGPRWGDWPLDLQFCTWAILAKPGHRLMERTVDRVIGRLKALAREQKTTVSGIQASYDDVLSTTGPSLFTEAVIEGLAESTGTDFIWKNITGMTEARLVDDGTCYFKTIHFPSLSLSPEPHSGGIRRHISRSFDPAPMFPGFRNWILILKTVILILEPPLSTVLILPINAFGSGQAHSNSGSPDDPTALVHHLFKGSWKADHPPSSSS